MLRLQETLVELRLRDEGRGSMVGEIGVLEDVTDC